MPGPQIFWELYGWHHTNFGSSFHCYLCVDSWWRIYTCKGQWLPSLWIFTSSGQYLGHHHFCSSSMGESYPWRATRSCVCWESRGGGRGVLIFISSTYVSFIKNPEETVYGAIDIASYADVFINIIFCLTFYSIRILQFLLISQLIFQLWYLITL